MYFTSFYVAALGGDQQRGGRLHSGHKLSASRSLHSTAPIEISSLGTRLR